MSRIWVTDTAGHFFTLTSSSRPDDIFLDPAELPGDTFVPECLIVDANAGHKSRASRLGLRWLQRYRRERRSTAPALVYSFESRRTLEVYFSMLKAGMPGIGFLRCPFDPEYFEERLNRLTPLTGEQLQEFLRWHGGLQDVWRAIAHDLGGTLNDYPGRLGQARYLLETWESSVREFAPEQGANIERLKEVFGIDIDETRACIQRLDDELCGSGGGTEPEELQAAPFSRPPRGFSTIAVADDNGYEPLTIKRLRRFGYDVSEPALNLKEAESLLRFWCPHVVLADLHFPTLAEGRELMRQALESECLVIAISRSRAGPSELPEEVEDCCGGLDYQDAERIHRLIWKRARSEGVEDHV